LNLKLFGSAFGASILSGAGSGSHCHPDEESPFKPSPPSALSLVDDPDLVLGASLVPLRLAQQTGVANKTQEPFSVPIDKEASADAELGD
jgi:hypothetical protein